METQAATLKLQTNTTVVGRGFLSSGEEIVQELSMKHDVGAPEEQIMAHGFNMFKTVGGLLRDEPDKTMKFYAFGVFPDGVKFELKKVQLASVGIVRS